MQIDTVPTADENTRLSVREGYPSGQREQTVNLPAYAFVGSNPTPSTMAVERVVWLEAQGAAEAGR